MSDFQHYTQTTYYGKRLLENHSLNESGMWQIFGEDPNCELAGPHHMPDLGIVEGKLKDVIEHAVNLSSFWCWGGGGEIRKLGSIPKISANARTTALKEEALRLKERLMEIDKELSE